MILMLMFLCNLLAVSAISWISLWIMMEITTYLFLSYSVDQMEMKNKFEFLLTYFLVSFISSCFLLISFFFQEMNSFSSLTQTSIVNESYTQFLLLSIAFLLKMGSIPFHPWVFSVLENLKWKIMVILTTIQKIIPIWALTFFADMNMLIIIIMLSMLLIMYIPLKMKSTFYFMATSATNNIIWILLSILSSPFTVFLYSMIYFIMTVNVIHNFSKNNMKMMNQNYFSFSLLIPIFSLMGMPPLLGFIPKLNTIINTTQMSEEIIFIMMFLVIANCFTTIMYMKPLISSLTFNLKNSMKMSFETNFNSYKMWLIHISWPILIPLVYMVN